MGLRSFQKFPAGGRNDFLEGFIIIFFWDLSLDFLENCRSDSNAVTSGGSQSRQVLCSIPGCLAAAMGGALAAVCFPPVF